ncbi:MAG: CoA transferase subunit A [Sphaerospermopsis sp. SIO1G2]|nr:CoA transferase subunit A [Sphaerospermopsis sp. SIO1G2]
MNKLCRNAEEALTGELHDGMTIMAGGFGLCGIPEHAIDYIGTAGTKALTVISNNCGVDNFGLGKWLAARQISKMVASYVGENKEFERQFLSGELTVEFNPQGTLAERIRAGGAGIPAFYTKTGVGTLVAKGKETRNFGGETYVMEQALIADLAILKAWRGDKYGNVIYRKTARNFNAPMATASRFTVVEIEELVDPEQLDADTIHTPGIFVDKLFVGAHFEKRIEFRTISDEAQEG